MPNAIQRLAAALLGAAALAAGPARGEEPVAAGDAEAFAYGALQLGLLAGHAWGFGDPFASEGTENEDVQIALLAPSLGIGISDLWGRDTWYRGSFALFGEGQLWWNHEPRGGFGGGVGALLRYQFLALRELGLVPFAEGGAGLGGIDFDLRSQDDGFNFLLQTGAGVHWLLLPETALCAGYRYHHISNAGSRRPNIGINSHLVYFGITYFLR